MNNIPTATGSKLGCNTGMKPIIYRRLTIEENLSDIWIMDISFGCDSLTARRAARYDK